MTCIFIDDDAPESEEYESNYVCYDEDSLESTVRALNRAQRDFAPDDPRAAFALRRIRESIARLMPSHG
jgi:hypothetical protein